MIFSKAIQIKGLINRWNQQRVEYGFGYVSFECSMFMDGEWSVTLRLKESTLFFSSELNQLITLYAGGGFIMTIGAFGSSPRISMQ